jgi:hypothetical protein
MKMPRGLLKILMAASRSRPGYRPPTRTSFRPWPRRVRRLLARAGRYEARLRAAAREVLESHARWEERWLRSQGRWDSDLCRRAFRFAVEEYGRVVESGDPGWPPLRYSRP